MVVSPKNCLLFMPRSCPVQAAFSTGFLLLAAQRVTAMTSKANLQEGETFYSCATSVLGLNCEAAKIAADHGSVNQFCFLYYGEYQLIQKLSKTLD